MSVTSLTGANELAATTCSPPPTFQFRLFNGDDPEPEPERRLADRRLRMTGPASPTGPTPTLPASESPPPPPQNSPTLAASATVWPLRAVLERFRRDWEATRKPATWSQYKTLLKRWERHHSGPGPCVSTLTSELLSAFFHAVPEWSTPRMWERSAVQLSALLKTACRQSHDNREGLPRDIAAPCSRDDLPFVVMPSAEWFRSHRKSGEHRSGGHTPKRRSTLSLDQFQRVVDACWTTPDVDPVWWETLFGWLWFSGMRITQARTQLAWCDDGQGEGLDLSSRSLVTRDSKCDGLINIPLPDCLITGLTWLRCRTGRIVFERQNVKHDRAFRIRWRKIWDHAIPVTNDTDRELRHFAPHELRAVSVTNWELSPDRAAGHLITGHAPGDVRESAYYVPGDSRLRAIVNAYQMPKLHAADSALPLT